jgi:3-oxoacyl-[acyl-carrier-protein] synthase II
MKHLRLYPGEQEADDALSVAVTGIGMVSSIGRNREEMWRALQRGEQGCKLHHDIAGIHGLDLPVAYCDWIDPKAPCSERAIAMAMSASGEALADCNLDLESIDRSRFAIAVSAHFGDTQFINDQVLQLAEPSDTWWKSWLPSTGCSRIAERYQLGGPRLCHSTACASSLISVIMAARQLFDQQCDYILAGGMDAVQPLLLAAFQRMGVLAPPGDLPGAACKPFDRNRNGFVLGEGSAMLVLERTADAKRRGAKIYGEIVATQLFAEAAHVTSLDESGAPLTRLLNSLLRRACWQPGGVDYINAHGTGTEQNDRNELSAVTTVFGSSPSHLAVSSVKGMIGHTINAAGSLELATTLMAMRDGYRPGTRNLVEREPIGDIDCLANEGTISSVDRAIKMSVAFGGHLAAAAIQKSDSVSQRNAEPLDPCARIRQVDNSQQANSAIRRVA